MQLTMHSTLRDPHAGAPATSNVTIYKLLAARARATSRRTLGAVSAGAGLTALAAVLLGAAHWTLLTACYLVWSFAVWGLVFAPEHPRSPAWRATEYLLVASDTILVIALAGALFFLALGPRWVL